MPLTNPTLGEKKKKRRPIFWQTLQVWLREPWMYSMSHLTQLFGNSNITYKADLLLYLQPVFTQLEFAVDNCTAVNDLVSFTFLCSKDLIDLSDVTVSRRSWIMLIRWHVSGQYQCSSWTESIYYTTCHLQMMDCQMEILNTILMKPKWDCKHLAVLDYVPKMIKSWWFPWGSLFIATEKHRVLTVNGLQTCQPSSVTFIRIVSTFSKVMYLRLYLYELSFSRGGAEDVQPSGRDKISAVNISAKPQICLYEAMRHIDIGTQHVISHPHYMMLLDFNDWRWRRQRWSYQPCLWQLNQMFITRPRNWKSDTFGAMLGHLQQCFWQQNLVFFKDHLQPYLWQSNQVFWAKTRCFVKPLTKWVLCPDQTKA